jgi:pyruvate,orthophosphate dikinase
MAKKAVRKVRQVRKVRPVRGTKSAGRTAKARYVYFFGNGKADGDRSMRDVLGGKGAGLAEMTNAGLPVPPGFTISTGACTIYYEQKGKMSANVDQEMLANLK